MSKGVYIFLLIVICSCRYSESKIDKEESIIENEAYDKAWEFFELEENDSAYIYFNKSYSKFTKSKNNHQAAKCLLNMAFIGNKKGDWFSGQELTIEAIKLLNPQIKDEKETLSSAYNILGQTQHDLGIYKEAINYYQKAIDFSTERDVYIINQNNIANSYRYDKQYDEAIKIYEELLKDKTTIENPKEYARITDNLAYTKWLKDNKSNVVNELNKALNIRLKENDLWGQNASYAHLTDYFSNLDHKKALD